MPGRKETSRLIYVGLVQKPHALKGEVKAKFHYHFTGKTIKTLYIGDDKPLPCRLEQIQPIGKNMYILKIRESNNRNESEELAGKKIFALESDFEKHFESDDVASLIGWKAMTGGTELGIIEDIFALPQQHLAQVIVEGKEVLIPLNEETIVKIDKKKKTLFLELPDGLLNL